MAGTKAYLQEYERDTLANLTGGLQARERGHSEGYTVVQTDDGTNMHHPSTDTDTILVDSRIVFSDKGGRLGQDSDLAWGTGNNTLTVTGTTISNSVRGNEVDGTSGTFSAGIKNTGALLNTGTITANAIRANQVNGTSGTFSAGAYISGGNLGVGTVSSTVKLHVWTSASGQTNPSNSGDELVLENSGECGMSILSGATDSGMIMFGDSSDADIGRIQYLHTDNSMRFRTNTTDFLHANSGGNVGIGTAGPNGRFHIWSANSGQTSPSSSANQLVLESSSNAGLSILTGASSQGLIYFGDSGDADIGRIQYNHADNSMRLRTNATDALHIKSNQHVGFGTADPQAKLHVQVNTGGLPSISASNVAIFQKNNATDEAAHIAIIAGPTGVSQINFGDTNDADSGRISYDHVSLGMRFYSNGLEKMRYDSTGRFGVGTAGATGKIHSWSGNSGQTSIAAGADELVLENSGNTGMTILSSTTGTAFINFGDSGANNVGGIQYEHGGEKLKFVTNGAFAGMIDSNGRMSIGTDGNDGGLLRLSGASPEMWMSDTDGGDLFSVGNNDGVFTVYNRTDTRADLTINGAGTVTMASGTYTDRLTISNDIPTLAMHGTLGTYAEVTGQSNGIEFVVYDTADNSTPLGLSGNNSVGTASVQTLIVQGVGTFEQAIKTENEVFMANVPIGSTQGDAGAVAGQVWVNNGGTDVGLTDVLMLGT